MRTAALMLCAHRGGPSAVDRSGGRPQGRSGAPRPLDEHFGEDRDSGGLGRARAEVEADGTVDPRNLFFARPGVKKCLGALGVRSSASQCTHIIGRRSDGLEEDRDVEFEVVSKHSDYGRGIDATGCVLGGKVAVWPTDYNFVGRREAL